MELGLARQATVPSARRPARGGGERGRRGGAPPRGAEALTGDLEAPEGSERGELAGRWDKGAEKEGKVAGAAAAAEGMGGGGRRSLRADRAARHCSALLAPLDSLTLPSAARLHPPHLRR